MGPNLVFFVVNVVTRLEIHLTDQRSTLLYPLCTWDTNGFGKITAEVHWCGHPIER